MSSAWASRINSKALNRARSFFALAAAYVVNNANDDHGRPGREDYSVLLLDPDGVEDFTVTQEAWAGPWRSRGQGNTTSADSAWAARVTGTEQSSLSAWLDRVTGTGTSATSARAARLVGITATTATSTYRVRIDAATNTT